MTRAPWAKAGANYIAPKLTPEQHQKNIDAIRAQLDKRYGPEKSGSALAEGIRLDAKEVEEGRGPWLGVTHTCRSCQRQSLSLEDGWCPQCNQGGK